MHDCILWTGATVRGYGVRRIGGRAGKTVYVHRLACEEMYGPPPTPEHLALHTCNTPRCYNGEHLYWGTKKQNAEDSRMAGTMALGRRHGAAKLSEDAVQKIRASALSSYKLAAQTGIAASTIRGIRNGHGNWRWLQ